MGPKADPNVPFVGPVDESGLFDGKPLNVRFVCITVVLGRICHAFLKLMARPIV